MNVISRVAIERAKQAHPHCRQWLDNWWRVAKAAHWHSLQEVRRSFPSADQVGGRLVFDAPEAKRLIVGVSYASHHPPRGGTLFVKHFLTHAEYDLGTWKTS